MNRLRANEIADNILRICLAAFIVLLIVVFIKGAIVIDDIEHKINELQPAPANSELEEVALEYLRGQIEYYDYNLAGLKAYDAERGYVFGE